MAVSYYFDEMLSRRAAEQLIQRGYSVIMSNDVGVTGKKMKRISPLQRRTNVF
jgi:hypothetical protein